MQTAAILKRFRVELPGCIYVAFADLDAGMVLGTSAVTEMPQEYWDSLCETAITLLDGDVARQVARLLSPKVDGGAGHAILAEGGSVGVFLRSRDNPSDVLCCVCKPGITVDSALAAMKSCLGQIDADA